MFLLSTTFSLVLGLYFARNNLVISILITLTYFAFILYRFGKRKFLIVAALFGIGVLIPRVTFASNNGPDYGGIVIDVRDNYYLFQSKFERYYVYSKDNDFEIGDHLVIKGDVKDFKTTSYESQFDFKSYLRNTGTTKELVVKQYDIKRQSIIKIHHFKKRFLSKFDENTATLISAFLFNDKDYSSSLVNYASNSSVLFLFSLSGVYLHVLFAIANYLFLLKFSKKTSNILTFILFLPLAFFSFTKIGTLRVFGLYLLKILNEFFFKRKLSHVQLVSILALIFLSIDYHLVYQEAFYIGFLLSVFAPICLNSTKCIKNKRKQRLISSFLFILIIYPIQIRGSVYTPFYSLKISVLMPINFVFISLAILCTFLPLTRLLVGLGKAITWILEKMDTFNIRIPFGDWGGAFSVLFISGVLLLVFYLEAVRLKHANIAVLCLMIMTTISVVPLQEPLSNCVYFVNVGQGDSIIIKNRTHTVMIDTGGYKGFDMAEETLIPFMNKKKITHLDALILTHDDFDHSGAKDSLISNFKVNNLLTQKNQFPYKVGDLNITNLNTYNFGDENDDSLVLSLNFMGKKFLFMGDASVITEEKILEKYDVDCDILKVGHHGSNTSTSEKFIKAASPKEAIISCGGKNSYGHPHKEIIERLNKYNVKIRRTDIEGTICYFSLRS